MCRTKVEKAICQEKQKAAQMIIVNCPFAMMKTIEHTYLPPIIATGSDQIVCDVIQQYIEVCHLDLSNKL